MFQSSFTVKYWFNDANSAASSSQKTICHRISYQKNPYFLLILCIMYITWQLLVICRSWDRANKWFAGLWNRLKVNRSQWVILGQMSRWSQHKLTQTANESKTNKACGINDCVDCMTRDRLFSERLTCSDNDYGLWFILCLNTYLLSRAS